MRLIKAISALLLGLLAVSCADHRDTRTEIFNENTYLDKDFLTRPNPNNTEEEGWLMGLSVSAVSVPTAVSDIFPGLQSDVRYVRFGFTHNKMQIVDGIVPGPYYTGEGDAPMGNPLEASNLAPRVLQEYEGNHVDIQLRKNLDGEVTNFVEEYKERDWIKRQFFKTDLDKGAFDDLTKLSWYYDWATSPAMDLVSSTLVPGSLRYVDTVAEESNFSDDETKVDWAKGDYIEWTVRATYNVYTQYASLMVLRQDIDTQTIDIKYSFWRRPQEQEGFEYVAREIAEKDKYRKQYGIWDWTVRNYQDPETGLIGAKMYLQRFNPKKEINYYMLDVPPEYAAANPNYDNKTLYESVGYFANKVFEEAGVDARISFQPADYDGIVREFGDIRYSFVRWHNNAFTDIPWLGYGPSNADPRTGEIFSATLNFNYWMGLKFYTEVVQEYLEKVSDGFDPENLNDSCTTGEVRPVVEDAQDRIYNTTLFTKLKSYMGDTNPDEWTVKHDENFEGYFRSLMPDLRFFYPPYQTFVYSGRQSGVQSMKDYREELLDADRDFWDIASKLDSGKSPFGHDDFSSPAAIEKGLEFVNRTKDSMQAHMDMQADRTMAAGLRGICLMEDSAGIFGAITNINQRCVNGKWQTFEEWERDIRWRIAHQTSVHELGHNIGQFHNFMGSMDRAHYQGCTVEADGSRPNYCILPEGEKGTSSSVMDYVHHFAEVSADLGYFPYDRATLIYAYRYDDQAEVDKETDADVINVMHPEWVDGTPTGKKDLTKTLFYGNDYIAPLSPFVKTFDYGSTPTEIVLNHIEYYDWMYQFRNFRSYRKYWETWTYPNSAFGSTFALRRFLDLWGIDFAPSEIENELRILGVEGTPFDFQNIADEFTKEMGQANRLIVNFYRAILNQSATERNYQTTYDTYFGDVTHLGIIYDKYYSMFSFLGLWGSDNYNWDIYSLLAFYESSFGNDQFYSDALETVKVMMGGSYDVYPWFLPTAALLFAQDTHNINFGDQTMKEWMGSRMFTRVEDMVDFFDGVDPRDVMDGSHHAFRDQDGSEWTYIFLDDRLVHVLANADLNPLMFKMIWDYNEDVLVSKADYVDTSDIKYFVDFYNYFERNIGYE